MDDSFAVVIAGALLLVAFLAMLVKRGDIAEMLGFAPDGILSVVLLIFFGVFSLGALAVVAGRVSQ